MTAVDIGTRVGGYRITGGHPSGGFRAVDVEHRRVLVELRLGEDWRASATRHLRAASVVASIGHPGMARIIDHGALPDETPWGVSELASGLALAEVIPHRRFSPDETIALVRDVAGVLAAAHHAATVHGALRPHSIVLATGSRAHPVQIGGWSDLCSPGARRVPDRLDDYDAPELGHGRIEARSDVFTLGVIAYRTLTGRMPARFTPELVAGVPGVLGALVVRMLASDPEHRPSAAEVQLAASQMLVFDDDRATPRFARPRWTPGPMPVVPRTEPRSEPRREPASESLEGWDTPTR